MVQLPQPLPQFLSSFHIGSWCPSLHPINSPVFSQALCLLLSQALGPGSVYSLFLVTCFVPSVTNLKCNLYLPCDWCPSQQAAHTGCSWNKQIHLLTPTYPTTHHPCLCLPRHQTNPVLLSQRAFLSSGHCYSVSSPRMLLALLTAPLLSIIPAPQQLCLLLGPLLKGCPARGKQPGPVPSQRVPG